MSIQTCLREINNAVLDLQAADYNTFERPLKRLAAALNANEISQITEHLRSKANLDSFIEGSSAGGSMMGSARLNWPSVREEELGIVIRIIERAADDPNWFQNFAHTYYYSGSKIIAGIRKITSAVIVPFNRDFASYVDEFVPSLSSSKDKTIMAVDEDKAELLQALFELGRSTGKRPSVQDAGIKYFPDWDRERLFDAAQSLLDEGVILNPTGVMCHVDLSSTSRKAAEQNASASVSGVTYNIGAMHNSPLQHVESGGHGVQTTSYSTDDLRSIVNLYRQNVDELGLDATQRRRADAQISTIEAQLIDEPDPTIIKAAGKSLKTIVEGALGGAAGTALAAAPIWQPLISMFS